MPGSYRTAHLLVTHRIGNEAIAREDAPALRAYFREDYVFHGPAPTWASMS